MFMHCGRHAFASIFWTFTTCTLTEKQRFQTFQLFQVIASRIPIHTSAASHCNSCHFFLWLYFLPGPWRVHTWLLQENELQGKQIDRFWGLNISMFCRGLPRISSKTESLETRIHRIVKDAAMDEEDLQQAPHGVWCVEGLEFVTLSFCFLGGLKCFNVSED